MYPRVFHTLGLQLTQSKQAFFDVLFAGNTPRGRVMNKLLGRENIEDALGDTAHALGADVSGGDLTKGYKDLVTGKALSTTPSALDKQVLDPMLSDLKTIQQAESKEPTAAPTMAEAPGAALLSAALQNKAPKAAVYLGHQTGGTSGGKGRSTPAIQQGHSADPDKVDDGFLRSSAQAQAKVPGEPLRADPKGRRKPGFEERRDIDDASAVGTQGMENDWVDLILG